MDDSFIDPGGGGLSGDITRIAPLKQTIPKGKAENQTFVCVGTGVVRK
ncbi:hypothetical protein [uncultured Schumannella sp.]|nr:hypothetical protein [uncultured Schumannella sp.]